jgi:hypothetical protein
MAPSRLGSFFSKDRLGWYATGLLVCLLVVLGIRFRATANQNRKLSGQKATWEAQAHSLAVENQALKNSRKSAEALVRDLIAKAKKRSNILPETANTRAETLKPGQPATFEGINITKPFLDEADACADARVQWEQDRIAMSGALDQAELAVDVARRRGRIWRYIGIGAGALCAGLIVERVAR